MIHASNEPSRADLLNFAEIAIKAAHAEKRSQLPRLSSKKTNLMAKPWYYSATP